MVAAVCSHDTAPLPASSVNSPASSLVPDFAVPASPLQSAVPRPLTTADSKGLPENLSRLDSALTKNRGRGVPHFVTEIELSLSQRSLISRQINSLRTLSCPERTRESTNQHLNKSRISCSFFTLRTFTPNHRGWEGRAKHHGRGTLRFFFLLISDLRSLISEQLPQLLFPQHCPGVRTMPVRLLAFWNQHELSVLQAFRFALRDSEPRRIDKVVRRIHPQYARRNFLEVRRRIVIPRSIHLVQKVVHVQILRALSKIIRQEFVGCIARRQTLLHRNRRTACNNQKIQRHAYSLLRRLRIFAAL